jgi:hypothetical protein
MTEKVTFTGEQIADLLLDWSRAVVPRQRGFDVMARRPAEAHWQEFVTEQEAALDEALIALSALPRGEMADAVTGWSDDMVIALISRLANRAKALRQVGQEPCLSGPHGADPIGPVLLATMVRSGAMPR